MAKEADAVRIAKTLVTQQWAACANILPKIRSFYRWQGKICDDVEYLILFKTHAAKAGQLKTIIKELHPYDEPELIFAPITDGSPAYLQWLLSSLI